MSEYPWNEKNNTFTWLSSLYNPFNLKFQNCSECSKKTFWKVLYGLYEIYRETTKNYIKNILNQNCLKFKST